MGVILSTLATLATIAAAATGIAATSGAFKEKFPEASLLPALPEQPITSTTAEKIGETKAAEIEASAAEEARTKEIEARKKRFNRAKTILTSPEGILGEAPVARKTLLGE